ncbi:hypothetical protein FHS18_005560 [Paenibacillus phyllosphaerae]|uniref:Membrane protein NfeD2 N-terminal transmembrane domain-containing protein n=1 Tax=Paenibacillus phyllosphaerae TaxID=274593 RepID=A0A7W5B2X0_9BACL|nr:protease [Paenibacillus phyllosphaerae]MBB3113448.1 hypothetical protein [Paenibacillus phyllosphaerae]
METLFLSCLFGGVLFALVSVVLGDWLSVALDGALDFLSVDGIRMWQPMTVAGWITTFGGAGLLLKEYTGLGTAIVMVLACIVAQLLTLAFYFLYIRPMERSENSVGYSVMELVGVIAEVLTPVPAQGYGEVTLRVGASYTHHIASSYEGVGIAAGAKVVVVEVEEKEGVLQVASIEL